MLDDPQPHDIVGVVADLLRDQILPLLSGRPAFEVRVCISALELVGRQMALEPQHTREETARLAQLLGHAAPADVLNRELCARIEAGTMTLATPGLAEHLWATVMDKLAIDQPGYASYIRENAAASGGTP